MYPLDLGMFQLNPNFVAIPQFDAVYSVYSRTPLKRTMSAMVRMITMTMMTMMTTMTMKEVA
jgi:hypothetical protein